MFDKNDHDLTDDQKQDTSSIEKIKEDAKYAYMFASVFMMANIEQIRDLTKFVKQLSSK